MEALTIPAFSGESLQASRPTLFDSLLIELGERLTDEPGGDWPLEYVNNSTGKGYTPHTIDERRLVRTDSPKVALLTGGWGSGKSSAGAIKLLERVRRRMDCIMVSPDWPHFRKSFWPTFRDWCPWDQVVPKFQKYRYAENMPGGAGTLVFKNGAQIHYGGIHDASSWYGGNVHFALFDEGSRYPDASAFKSLLSRARLVGPNGESPQVVITTTPEMNWLAEYFGPPPSGEDPYADFRALALVVTIETEDNLENLDPEYVADLKRTLTPEEVNLFLRAQWVSLTDSEKFVNIAWWDACQENSRPWDRSEPAIIGIDAATGGETATADCFAVVVVTRHPDRRGDVIVRYSQAWRPPPKQELDFAPIQEEIERLCQDHSIIEVCYDKTQLHQMMQELRRKGINARVFGQGADRLASDRALQQMIMGKRIAHFGDSVLRNHIDNANVKKDTQERSVRIIKRSPSLKVDLAVALSMAADRCLYYSIA